MKEHLKSEWREAREDPFMALFTFACGAGAGWVITQLLRLMAM